MSKEQWLEVWVALSFAVFMGVLVVLLSSCDMVTGPAEAEYTVDCNNYFNTPCPEDGGDE